MGYEDFVAAFAEEWELTEEEAEAVLLTVSFDDFAIEAEAVGLSESEAADILDVLEGEADYEEDDDAYDDRSVSVDDRDYGEDDRYMLDSDWPDDEWLDAGDWYEISAEYMEK